MRVMKRAFGLAIILGFLSAGPRHSAQAGGFNIPADSDGGQSCKVTTTADINTVGSLRRALNQGYNVQQPGVPRFCSDKITFDVTGVIRLNEPILLRHGNFTLEKNPSLSGTITLDGSNLSPGTCLLEVEASHINLRGFEIQHPNGTPICIRRGMTNIALNSVTVKQSSENGILIEDNAQNVQLSGVTVNQSGRNGIAIGNNVQDVQLNQVTVTNSQQNGILVGANAQRFQFTEVNSGQSRENGLIFGPGSQNNTVRDGAFHNNGGFGVSFQDVMPSASRNLVSHNALYNNVAGPLNSANTQLIPSVHSVVITSLGLNNQHTYTLSGDLQNPVDRLEIYKLTPPAGSSTNFIRDEKNFNNGLRFVLDVTGAPGEQVFMLPIATDGTTGSPLILSLNDQTEADGSVCPVTSLLDDPDAANSVRRALNLGYKVMDPARTLCSQKIVFEKAGIIPLQEPLVFDNTSRPTYTLEKNPDLAEDVVLDGSLLPEGSCAIVVDANGIVLKGITVQNHNGYGICIRENRSGTLLNEVTATRNIDGVVIEAGAQNNTIQNGWFFENSGYGINLESATRNRVTQNALYSNAQGPLLSPAEHIMPTVNAVVSASAVSGGSEHIFTISGSVAGPVEHVEIYRSALQPGEFTNFVKRVDNFNGLNFVTDITAHDGEEIFVFANAADGTTSAVSIFQLNAHDASPGGETGADGTTCHISSLLDDPNAVNSLRKALNSGYQVNNPATTLCAEKINFKTAGVIVLQDTIELNNTSRSNYLLEKDPSVTGSVVLDGSNLPSGSCVITVDANQITLRGIEIRHPSGDGVCIASGRNGTLLDQVTVKNSRNGAVVKTGAQGNTIQNGAFHDNSQFGIKLESALFNTVTQNALYRNGMGPLDSPALDIMPALTSVISASPALGGSSQFTFSVSGKVPNPVGHVEIFSSNLQPGATTNYIGRVDSFSGLNFVTNITIQDGQDVFILAIGSDGTTSGVSTYRLSTSGGVSASLGVADGVTCPVTSFADDANIANSFRRALEFGYNELDPALTLCSQKISFNTSGVIPLKEPILLDNASRLSYTLEKGAETEGEVILDGSQLPPGSCVITIAANQVTLKGITIQNPNGDGVCIAAGRNGNKLDQITVKNSRNGAVVKGGAQGNTIQNGFYHDNSGFGVKLEDATFNHVTQNALYRNGAGPLDSPAIHLTPSFTSSDSKGSVLEDGQVNYVIRGEIPMPVNRIEIFRSIPPMGSDTNFLKSVNAFDGLRFKTDITTFNGEGVFAIAVGNDGTTSAVSGFGLPAHKGGCALSPYAAKSDRYGYGLGFLFLALLLGWARKASPRISATRRFTGC